MNKDITPKHKQKERSTIFVAEKIKFGAGSGGGRGHVIGKESSTSTQGTAVDIVLQIPSQQHP